MQGYTLGDVDGLPERTVNAQPRPLRQLLTFNEPNHVDQVGNACCPQHASGPSQSCDAAEGSTHDLVVRMGTLCHCVWPSHHSMS